MIRVYLDWNIFSYLRQFRENRKPYTSLNRYLTQSNHSVLIPYTSAHLTDLIPSFTSSEKGKVETKHDIDYLAALTNHNCILYNHKGKLIYCNRYNLHEYFEQLVESNELKYNSVESLFRMFNDTGLGQLSKSIIDLLKVLPTGIDPELPTSPQKTTSPLMNIFEKTLKGLILRCNE